MNLDLRKQLVLDLKKEKGIEGVSAKVALVLDFSGSMSSLYSNGDVDKIIERILPVALGFDDDGEVDFYLFHNDVIKVDKNINTSNYNSGIAAYVMSKYRVGGTSYAPAISKVVSDMADGTPVFVIFITDGANDDKSDTKKAMIAASSKSAFFQFIGIGSANFPQLEKLDDLAGRKVDNASFVKATDLNSVSDRDLYTSLLGEFPQWLQAAKKAGIIR